MSKKRTRVRLKRDSKGRFIRRSKARKAVRKNGRKRMPHALLVNPRPRRRRKARRPNIYRAATSIRAGGPIRGKLRRMNPKKKRAAAKRRKPRSLHYYARQRLPEGVPVAGSIYKNPRRRRRSNGGRRRRSNPAFIGRLLDFKALLGPAIAGAAAGAVAGFADTKFLSRFGVVGRSLAKIAVAAVGGAVLRKKPALASAFIGGVTATIGYDFAMKAAGGVVAPTSAAAAADVKAGMGDLAITDPGTFAALVEEVQGMGALVEDMGDFELDTSPDLGSMIPLDTDVSLGSAFDDFDDDEF